MAGFIKLHRELIKKPIWLNSTPEQKSILIAILLSVNFVGKEWEWNGEKYKVLPGQMITSLDTIKRKCGKGISIQNVRTSLKRFEKLEFLTNKPTKTGRLIIIINWDSYQIKQNDANKDTNKDLTKTSQRPNKDLTPNKKVEKVKKVENKEILFENFWNIYDNKKGYKKCKDKFLKLKQTEIDIILKTLPDYVKSTIKTEGENKTGGFIPMRKNPITYLKNDSWNDEIIKPKNNHTGFKEKDYGESTPSDQIGWLKKKEV